MLDRVLVIEDFADKVGEVFAVSLQDADIALNLIEASPLPNRRGPDSRLPMLLKPFSLADAAAATLSRDARLPR